MAFSSTSLKRSLTLLAGGVIAFAMVWYFKSRQRQRNYKQVKSKAKELTNKAADNQDLEVIATDQCVHDNTKPLTDSDDKANVKENYVVCAAVENDTFNDGFGNLDKSALKDNEVKSSDGNDSNSSFISSLASSENEADVDESNADRNKVSTDDVKKPEKYMDFEISEEPFSWSEEVKNSTIRMNKENEDPGDKSKTFETEDDAGYKSEKSPTVHSEQGSQDSGRATEGPPSSVSPAQDTMPDRQLNAMYEFEIPNSLVGLIIGVKGKTIRELSNRTNVKMIIHPHRTPNKMKTHQTCTVEGSRANINKCLQMLRRHFPVGRFPELNLKPVLPPPLASPDIYSSIPVQLSLPEGIRNEVIVSAYVDAGHFFIQQPNHPSFSSLHRLDYYMLVIYSQSNGVPDLPRPCETGLLCVAPTSGGWYRAVTVIYYEKEDEVLVRFVDYGGYLRVPRADLRQIRTDFMTLPFQAVECLLAHVEPVDGSSTWYAEANEMFGNMTANKILKAFVVGYNIEDNTPIVELFTVDENNLTVRVDRALLDAGLAKASDPSKVQFVPPKPIVNTLATTGNV